MVLQAGGGFKIGGLGSGPFLKMGCFQNRLTCEKRDFGAKNKKETYFFKWSLYELSRLTGVGVGVVGGGGRAGLSRGTYPYCPNMGVTPGGCLCKSVFPK